MRRLSWHQAILLPFAGLLFAAGSSLGPAQAALPLPQVPTTAPVPPALTATPVNCPLPFTDVDQFNPFYQYIQCLYCRGIISGYSDNTFRWTADVTRGQVAKIIANAAGLDNAVSEQTFTDVPPGSPFYLYIERLAATGAVGGYDTVANCPTGVPCFRPELAVTRGQLAKIDANAAGYAEFPPAFPTFNDVPPANPFYVFVERLALHAVINGYTCGGAGEPCPGRYYRPNANITRGQVSKVAALTFFPNGCAPPPGATAPPTTATATPTATATAPPTTATVSPTATATATPTTATASPTATATAIAICTPTWRIEPNPGPNNSAELRGLAAVAANDVWAVGNYQSGGYQPLVEHWNGAAWSLVAFPTPAPGTSWLNAVAAVAADDVWAVGSSTGGTLIAHWDGVSWALVPAPNPEGGLGSLAALTVLAADDIWAVGTYPSAGYLTSLVMHWDGTQWTIVPSPNRPADDNPLLGVAAVAPNDIWAVGGGQRTLIEHWDGTQWTIVPGAEDPTLETRLAAVTALAPADVWAVGQFFDALDNGRTLIQHWDGTQWHVVPSADAGESFLFAIAAVTPQDIWAAGWGTNPYTLAEHWDGQQWSLSPVEVADGGLYGLAVVNSGDIWAVGQDSAGALIEHYACPVP
jgi:hypothetical protein